MARGRGRGGYRSPSKPAAASGPGALSQRTDGGPQYSGLDYGENKAVNDQMASAPMPGGGGGAPAAQPQRRPTVGREGVFGPSDRPGEPLTAGIDFGPGPGSGMTPKFENDANYVVRAIAAENPHLAEYLLGLADA